MAYKIITSDHFHSIGWSGGTTTELFIFPLKADYKKRNFQFRLSTAKVDTDRSDFTVLKGISRKLLVLEGKTTLIHENHYSRQLNKFEIDEFEGDWKTSSVGKCTDFNLMTTGKSTGDLSAIVIEKGKYLNWDIIENCDWFFIYTYSGKVRIEMNNETFIINRGDLLILNKPITRTFEINGIENSELVFSEIIL